MAFDPAPAMAALSAARASLGSTPADQDAYLNAARALLAASEPAKDDHKEAAKLAIEAAKLFITIGLAGIAVLGGFVQFAVNRGRALADAPVILFGASAFLILLSIALGFLAISNTYRRVDGRIPATPDGRLWSTAAIKGKLDGQAYAGVGAILAFAAAIMLLAAPSPAPAPGAQQTVTIALPSQPAVTAPAGAPIVVEGNWSSLVVRTTGGPLVQLPAVAAGATESLSITWRLAARVESDVAQARPPGHSRKKSAPNALMRQHSPNSVVDLPRARAYENSMARMVLIVSRGAERRG
jgi:hypothetical protein